MTARKRSKIRIREKRANRRAYVEVDVNKNRASVGHLYTTTGRWERVVFPMASITAIRLVEAELYPTSQSVKTEQINGRRMRVARRRWVIKDGSPEQGIAFAMVRQASGRCTQQRFSIPLSDVDNLIKALRIAKKKFSEEESIADSIL